MSDLRRVALDARRLAGNRRGTGLYISNLVRSLPEAAPDVEFLLLVDQPLPADRVPEGCRAVVVGRRPPQASQWLGQPRAQFSSVFWMNGLVPGVLSRERVDVFHGTNVAVPMVGGSRCVATIHDLVSVRVPGTFTRFYEFYRKRAVPAAARRAAHIIAVSESTKRDVLELTDTVPEKVTVIHHGVDASFTPVMDSTLLDSVRRRLDLPARYVLHVGAVERQKRLEPMMRAAAAVLGERLADGVVLAGEEGFGADGVRRIVTELGIADRVRFLGYVPQEMIPSLYTLARCAVYPSWYEGFGMPVLEAMACGTPVVTSNVSSLPEVAGNAGITVSPGDVQAIAQAIRSLLTDEQLRARMIDLGLARARSFRWSDTAARHVEVYRRVHSARQR